MGELLPGRHVLAVASPGMAARLEIDVQAGVAPITLRMQPTRRVRIRVCNDDGSPVSDGLLQVMETVSFDFGRQVDACGSTDWELLPGSYDTRYVDAEMAPIPSPAIVVEPAPAGDDPGVEIVLRLPAKPASSPPK